MSTKIIGWLFVVCAVLGGYPGTVFATECVKSTGAGGCFMTIQGAVDAADPGERINIKSGTYFENVVIPAGKDGVQLVGVGSRKRVILDPDSPNTGIGILIQASNVVIRNLTIRNGENDAIEVALGGAGSEIDKVDVFGPENSCIQVFADSVTIRRSRLYGCDTAIDVQSTGTNVTIDRNFIQMCDADCVTVRSGANGAEITNNNISQAEDGNGLEIIADGFLIRGNRVSHNDDDGINAHCTPCTNALIEKNSIRHTAQFDEHFEVRADAAGLVVRDNKADASSRHGFYIRGVGIVVEGNRVRYHGAGGVPGIELGYGFYVEGDGHTLTNNIASAGADDGFHIEGIGHSLDGNTSSKNAGDGFDVEGENIMLDNNKSQDNRGIGIEVSSTAMNTALVDNQMKRNRTDFCDEGTGTTDTGSIFDTTGACAIGD